MLYLSVKSIYLALKKIQTPEGKLEHTTGRAANGLANHYFYKQKFSVTPEQIQKKNLTTDQISELSVLNMIILFLICFLNWKVLLTKILMR